MSIITNVNSAIRGITVGWCTSGYICPNCLTVIRILNVDDEIHLFQDIKDIHISIAVVPGSLLVSNDFKLFF
jgi:hypothetical protein